MFHAVFLVLIFSLPVSEVHFLFPEGGSIVCWSSPRISSRATWSANTLTPICRIIAPFIAEVRYIYRTSFILKLWLKFNQKHWTTSIRNAAKPLNLNHSSYRLKLKCVHRNKTENSRHSSFYEYQNFLHFTDMIVIIDSDNFININWLVIVMKTHCFFSEVGNAFEVLIVRTSFLEMWNWLRFSILLRLDLRKSSS
jgi:hypothetical protein